MYKISEAMAAGSAGAVLKSQPKEVSIAFVGAPEMVIQQ
jgi:hypothetical protein